jgi:RimJ/RimL family protein N-acetyltransferase
VDNEVQLRAVIESDLPIFFEHQIDPQAAQMAAFPSRGREAFMAHWAKILADETNIIRAILFEGQVAGNVLSFIMDGRREVGYWLGREFWGRGIATRALSAFLEQVTERPLYAYVAKPNLGSLRVLQKCGFFIIREEPSQSDPQGQVIEYFVLELAGNEKKTWDEP